MVRPRKRRRVEQSPRFLHFRATEVGERGEVVLLGEELEAIRLKDLEGLDQVAAAERMGVSRPTFQRILRAGRRKVAEALVGGLGIRVEADKGNA